MTSALYARDYNETKTLGGARSTARTAAQTDAVKFWTQANLPSLAQRRAPTHAAKNCPRRQCPALCAAQHGHRKHVHHRLGCEVHLQLLAAVTAIRNGDIDGNDATERDAGWTALNDTPMHPEYPSQAAIISGVRRRVMESVFGPKPAMPVTSSTSRIPTEREFRSINAWTRRRNVRVWGGIHFRNSLDVGYDMGNKIAVYLIENSIKPRR